jgi:hypothetical protein
LSILGYFNLGNVFILTNANGKGLFYSGSTAPYLSTMMFMIAKAILRDGFTLSGKVILRFLNMVNQAGAFEIMNKVNEKYE